MFVNFGPFFVKLFPGRWGREQRSIYILGRGWRRHNGRAAYVWCPVGARCTILFEGRAWRRHDHIVCFVRATYNLLPGLWLARARTLSKHCGPLARGPQSTARRLVDGDARSEQVFSSVGAQCSSAARSDHVLCCAPKARGARRRAGCFVCYRGLDWRGRALRASVVARRRAGLNLLPRSWSARAFVQRMSW